MISFPYILADYHLMFLAVLLALASYIYILEMKARQRRANKNNQKVNLQKLFIFEGFSKNGYHHVFQRICLRILDRTKNIFMRFLENLGNML